MIVGTPRNLEHNQTVDMQGFISIKYGRQSLELLSTSFRFISAPFSPKFCILNSFLTQALIWQKLDIYLIDDI